MEMRDSMVKKTSPQTKNTSDSMARQSGPVGKDDSNEVPLLKSKDVQRSSHPQRHLDEEELGAAPELDDGTSSLWQRMVHLIGTKLGNDRLLGTHQEARNGGRLRAPEQDDESAYDEDALPTTNGAEPWPDHRYLEAPEKGGTSSFLQAMINAVALLFGMGLLALPYAAAQGGWSSLILLVLFAIMCCYTGCVLGNFMRENHLLRTYQDIAGAALGMRGRLIFTLCLYAEILACLVGFTISITDNLTQLFPGLGLHLSWLHLQPSTFLPSLAMLVIAPTVLLRDLSHVAYLSLGGILTSLIIIGAVAWTGVSEIGFTGAIPFAHLGRWRFVVGLYAYCYAGHVVIPSIYTSMREPSKFPVMLTLSFTIATLIYIGFALLGASMFGEQTLSQITLNIPTNLTAATVVLWTTVLSPLSKYSLGIAVVATELESRLPFAPESRVHLLLGSIMRLCILLLILAVALAFPFFARTLDIIGSSISILMSIILPCIFDLILNGKVMPKVRIVVDVTILIVAVALAIVGTWSSSNVLA